MTVKILILDVETSPNLAYVWRMWKENIGAKQMLEHTQIMSFAAKWLNEPFIFYEDVSNQDEATVLKKLIDLLDEADMVVAHNGNKFDLPTIQGRALVNGLNPPSPYKVVDTLTTARYEFKFPSNSLEYLAVVLGVDQKGIHKEFPGFELWAECLKGNKKAWKEMKEYNIQDIIVLEQIYLKMLPYMRRHPNVAVYNENEETCCPRCGSDSINYRGYAYTNVGKYRRFVCTDCGSWGRHRFTELPLEVRKNLGVNAVN